MKQYKRYIAALLALCALLLGTACQQKQNVTMDIHAVWDEMQQSIEMGSMMELDDETLSSLYPEIPMDKIKDYVVQISLINVRATEIALFEATDEAAAQEIKTSVSTRKENLEQNWSTYLPDQYELVKNSTIDVYGKYVVFIVGDFEADAKAIVEKAVNGK